MAQVDRFSVTMPPELGEGARQAAARRDTSVSTWLTEAAADKLRNEKEHPEVTVLRQVAFGAPRSALLTAAGEAQMLVVGARGRGGLEGMSLGSVAGTLLQHSPCPVAVIHPTER